MCGSRAQLLCPGSFVCRSRAELLPAVEVPPGSHEVREAAVPSHPLQQGLRVARWPRWMSPWLRLELQMLWIVHYASDPTTRSSAGMCPCAGMHKMFSPLNP